MQSLGRRYSHAVGQAVDASIRFCRRAWPSPRYIFTQHEVAQ